SYLPLYSSAAPPHLPSFPTRRSSDLAQGSNRLRHRSSLSLHEPIRPRTSVLPAARRPCQEPADFSLPIPASPCARAHGEAGIGRSEEHTSELQSRFDLVCRLLLEKKK